jgi:hypothetical protein
MSETAQFAAEVLMPEEEEKKPRVSNLDDDRREHGRRRVLLAAKISLENADIDCVLREISHGGAKLCVDTAYYLPDVITFYVPKWDHHYQGRIQWRLGDLVGVNFPADHFQRPPPSLAFVITPPGHARFAATNIFKHYGYLVHEVDDLTDAITCLTALGPLHPLLHVGRPVLFAVSEWPQDDAALLLKAREISPGILILVATDRFCGDVGMFNGTIPRDFQSRQIREFLDENIG